MTDKEYEVQRERVRKSVQRWIYNLGLGGWEVSSEYVRDTGPASESHEGHCIAGSTHVMFEYLSAGITFYLPIFVNLSDEEVDRVVVHEFMHVLVNEMKADGLEHEERVCSQLTNAFLWVRNAALKEGASAKRTKKNASTKRRMDRSGKRNRQGDSPHARAGASVVFPAQQTRRRIAEETR